MKIKMYSSSAAALLKSELQNMTNKHPVCHLVQKANEFICLPKGNRVTNFEEGVR
jgi:hypothetical protein